MAASKDPWSAVMMVSLLAAMMAAGTGSLKADRMDSKKANE